MDASSFLVPQRKAIDTFMRGFSSNDFPVILMACAHLDFENSVPFRRNQIAVTGRRERPKYGVPFTHEIKTDGQLTCCSNRSRGEASGVLLYSGLCLATFLEISGLARWFRTIERLRGFREKFSTTRHANTAVSHHNLPQTDPSEAVRMTTSRELAFGSEPSHAQSKDNTAMIIGSCINLFNEITPMSHHYCPDCQSVCACPALDVRDCEHVCGQDEAAEESAPPHHLWPWRQTYPGAAPAWDTEDRWPC